ncbi:MAG: DUF4116 domain-containing protein [Chlamydiota bacterium]
MSYYFNNLTTPFYALSNYLFGEQPQQNSPIPANTKTATPIKRSHSTSSLEDSNTNLEDSNINASTYLIKRARRDQGPIPEISSSEAAIKIQRWLRSKLTRTHMNNTMTVFKESHEDPEAAWKVLKIFADSLHGKYYVFAHSSSLEHGYLVDMATHLDPSIPHPGFSSRWDSTRNMRPQGVAPVLFQNISRYLESDLCKDINEKRADDGYPNNAHILSCDGFLDNEGYMESAYHFFQDNSSAFTANKEFIDSFFQKYIQNPAICMFAVTAWLKGAKEYKLSKNLGRAYLIAIEKTTLQNEGTNYVWRSHAFGCVCNCIVGNESEHEKFIKTLEAHQDNRCIVMCPNHAHPQYRILTGNLEKDLTKKIFTFEALSDKTKPYQEFYWHLAHVIKQCQRLESITINTPQEELLSILLRIRFTLNPLKFSSDTLYQIGLETILSSKKEIFLKHSDYLTKKLPKGGFQQLWDFANGALTANKDFILIAVQENGLALQYASDTLKDDKEIVG